MLIQLDKRFQKKVKGMFEKYQFEVGILDDKDHKQAKVGKRGLGGKDVLKTFASGPARKQSGKSSGKTISEVSAENRKRMGFNYLTRPFEDQGSDIIKFSNEFFKMVFGISKTKKRAENLLQAIVRNPILRGDYGPNSPLTQKIKGFDRAMIDTTQLFKAIVAKCTIKGR